MTITETAIVPFEAENHNVVVAKNQALMELREKILVQGVHYGEPYKGAGKPTLLKPGAEMILERFKLWPRFIDRSMVESWDPDKPVFHYRYECQLVRRDTGEVWGAGIGSCNSMEDKYRWRAQERKCPKCGAENIRRSNNKDEWYCWKKTGGCGATFAINDQQVISQPQGKVPNTEVFTLVNTIDKMAQKRALIAATLNATGASTYFTQDVEDFPGYAGKVIEIDTPEIIEGDFTEPHAHDPETGEVKRDPAPKVLLDPVRAVENMVDEMDALEMENSRLAVSELNAHFGKKEEQPKRASKPRKVQTAPPATNGGNSDASLIALRDKIWPNWAGQTVPYSKTILELENMKINWTGHFWAGVHDGLGWQEQDVYTALGKDSLHDVSGSFGDICLLLVMKMPEAQSAPVGEA